MAHVPEEIEFATKPEIALEQLRWACAAGLPRGVALFDAGYGNNSAFRSEVTALGLTYVAGIVPTTTVWAPGTAPLPPKRWSGRGRRPTRLRRDLQRLCLLVLRRDCVADLRCQARRHPRACALDLHRARVGEACRDAGARDLRRRYRRCQCGRRSPQCLELSQSGRGHARAE